MSYSNLKREIRKAGEVEVALFEALITQPIVLKRWGFPLADTVMIRHVRISDFKETIAVTFRGDTFFDEKSFQIAKEIVESYGGIWSW